MKMIEEGQAEQMTQAEQMWQGFFVEARRLAALARARRVSRRQNPREAAAQIKVS